MVRAGYDVGDNFRVLRVGDARLQNSHHGGWARVDKRIQADLLADYRGIAFERGGPETIRQYYGAGGIGTIIVRVQKPAQHRAQPHHLEIRSSHYPGPIMVNPTVENSPNEDSVFTRERKSWISGTENAELSSPTPGALCRM